MIEDSSRVGKGGEGEKTVICCKVDWLIQKSACVRSARDDKQEVGYLSALSESDDWSCTRSKTENPDNPITRNDFLLSIWIFTSCCSSASSGL